MKESDAVITITPPFETIHLTLSIYKLHLRLYIQTGPPEPVILRLDGGGVNKYAGVADITHTGARARRWLAANGSDSIPVSRWRKPEEWRILSCFAG